MYAALHPERRELDVGFSTMKAIWGNRIAPGLLDRYLGRTGYRAQQTSEPELPGRPDNLTEPGQGEHGAHGRFGRRARRHSAQLWLAEHRRFALVASVGAAGLFAARIWGGRER